MSTSSSMTTTVGSVGSRAIIAPISFRDPDDGLKHASTGLIGRGPQSSAVGLDHPSANGELHSDPLRLGDEEPKMRRAFPGSSPVPHVATATIGRGGSG